MRKRYSLLSILLTIIGLIWLGFLITEESDQLWDRFSSANPRWLCAIIPLAVLNALLTAKCFALLLSHHAGRPIPFSYAAHLLFVSQVVRHLPGRFWGILYQVQETREHLPTLATLRANFDFLWLSTAFAVMLSSLVVANLKLGNMIAMILLLFGLGGLAWLLCYDWVSLLPDKLAKWLPKRIYRLLAELRETRAHTYRQAALLLGISLATWIIYFFIWHLYGKLFSGLANINLAYACAAYTLAWLAGFLSMITPSGLGVREAVFLLFSPELGSAATLAWLAVFIRVWMLVLDLLMFLIFLLLWPRAKKRHETISPGI